MSITEAEARKVAHLARIAVADESLPALATELNGILKFMEQLNEVDVEGVEPMTSVTPMRMKKREDVVTAGGRVLAVVGRGKDLAEARARAYAGVDAIDFEGAQWRTDIGLKAERGEITVPESEGAK